MNGGHHQRYMQQGVGNKYQQQPYQQHLGQQNHHHQQNHASGPSMGHQHNSSSGTVFNATPQSTFNTFHNGHSNHGQAGLHDNIAQHPQWLHQLQLAEKSRETRSIPNHHAKKDGVVSLKSRAIDQAPAEEALEEGDEERTRAAANADTARQDWNALDLSGQGLKALSGSLFRYEFLTKLFLDDNQLSSLGPVVGQLRRLTHLDISHNQIRELPEEIGMLVNLRELLAFHNGLQTLPDEIGYLFKLETLGIDGNPLDNSLRERIMRDGTKGLISHVRETAEGEIPSSMIFIFSIYIGEQKADEFTAGIPPDDRYKVQIDDSPASEVLSVMSYNILCDKYATIAQYGYTASRDLSWDYRKGRILEEIRCHNADIVCLQEIDRESFDDYFRPELSINDYRGIFWPKSRAKTMADKDAKLVDGCATFYKGSKYVILDKALVDFANIAINRQDMKGEHDTFNRVMPRDHIAVITFLENRMTGSRIIIGNAHLLWDPEFADVKLVQVAILLEQVTKYSEKWANHPPCPDKAAFRHSQADGEGDAESGEEPLEPCPSLQYSSGPQIPLIICGDFNCAADSGVYELITNGSVPGNHADMGNRGYGSLTRDGMAHPFKLKSAYNSPDELSFTNYTPNFTGILDYIWYSTNALQVRELLGNVDEEYLQKVPGFPNHWFPSDHLSLKADFSVKQRKEMKATESSNGAYREWERSK